MIILHLHYIWIVVLLNWECSLWAWRFLTKWRGARKKSLSDSWFHVKFSYFCISEKQFARGGSFSLSDVTWGLFPCTPCLDLGISLWGISNNREFKQITMAGADTATRSKFPPNWDTAHVRQLHSAVAWNLTMWVGMFRHSGCYVVFISLLTPFSMDILVF